VYITAIFRSAILRCYKSVYGKVVLDVGAGTGNGCWFSAVFTFKYTE